ncbi:MAG: calcium-binding protein [Ardenticatenaceae bacterium]
MGLDAPFVRPARPNPDFGVGSHFGNKCSLEPLEVWEDYLKQTLTFPFKAKVDYSQSGGPLQWGDQISVKRFSLIDDHYGLIVALRKGRRRYDLPLCHLTPLDPNSPNHEPIHLYRVWFANG